MQPAAFLEALRGELRREGLLGQAASRARCATRAAAEGTLLLDDVGRLAGRRTTARALATRRGACYADSYRYVTGYGLLMTEFLAAPVELGADARRRVARLGGLANLIVSHFDELVDGGWPRAVLLPRWALAAAATPAGRVILEAGVTPLPAPTRLIVRLVGEYFRRAQALPHARSHASVAGALRVAVRTMYEEEGRTPREWRRTRGSATLQRKTAMPLVVLGLAAWLASPECSPARYAQHYRWLMRVGKFIRWIDDAADLEVDAQTGAANLVASALARHRAPGAGALLATRIAHRGRRIADEWSALAGERADPDVLAVLETVLAAWVGIEVRNNGYERPIADDAFPP